MTATGEAGPAGFLGLSAMHVEADPPTMLLPIARITSALAAMLESKHFAISFLPRMAADLVNVFGGKSEIKGAQRFCKGEWSTLATRNRSPVYAGALGAFDCRLEQTIERKGSLILIGTMPSKTQR